MQPDKVLWQVLSMGHHRSSKSSKQGKAQPQSLWQQNEYLLGLHGSCAFADSRFATIKEENGKCYLLMKVLTGRAYANKNVWQKIKLRKNYAQALQQIELHLAHWPRVLVHKNKQRLTRIYQYLVRSRKLELGAPLRAPKRDTKRPVARGSRASQEQEVATATQPMSARPLSAAGSAEEQGQGRDGGVSQGALASSKLAPSGGMQAKQAGELQAGGSGQIGTDFVMEEEDGGVLLGRTRSRADHEEHEDEEVEEEGAVVGDNEVELGRSHLALDDEEDEDEDEEDDGEEEVQYLEDGEAELLERDEALALLMERGEPYALEGIAEGEDEGEEHYEEDEEEEDVEEEQLRRRRCGLRRERERRQQWADEEVFPGMDEDEAPQQQHHHQVVDECEEELRRMQQRRSVAKRGRGCCGGVAASAAASGGGGTSRSAKRRFFVVGSPSGRQRASWVAAAAWQQQHHQHLSSSPHQQQRLGSSYGCCGSVGSVGDEFMACEQQQQQDEELMEEQHRWTLMM